MTFGVPAWLWALALVPLLALLFVRAERRGALRLRQFVAPRLLPQLSATVNRFQRVVKFALLLVSLALAIVALAQPRWGYTYEEMHRKGLDLLFAVDTSRSMLSNDVPPNRLERVKLAAQDLTNLLQGDRVGLIAFAGRAFLQAPLTIDYDAAIDSINELDTNIIPEGGTNISDAITLAVKTFGKSATGNRALVIFTDGEDLSGDAVKTAKDAADAGVKIFTIGVGTPEGSLIPLRSSDGATAFVKDGQGQVVKSRLDEKRLSEIAEATGGLSFHLENGPRTMQQLLNDGLGKLHAGDIDARTSRRPIERYQWPLGGALLALAASVLLNDRKRTARTRVVQTRGLEKAAAGVIVLLVACNVQASSPGLNLYQQEKFPEAYQHFQQVLKENPDTREADKIQFDAGAAAYKMKDYGKALQSFSQALLSRDVPLQSKSHYNLGNTLYERGETQKEDAGKLADWTNALQHYEQTMKVEPQNKEAKDNYEFVKKKIEELKKKQEEKPTPTPTPSPSPSPQKDDKKDKKGSGGKDQKDQQKDSPKDGDQQKKDEEKKSDSKPENQKGSSSGKDDKTENGQDKPKDQQGSKGGNKDEKSENSTPSPTPGGGEQKKQDNAGASPSPSPSGQGDKQDQTKQNGSNGNDSQPPTNASPIPDANGMNQAGNETGSQTGENASPSPTVAPTPDKKLAGEVKGAAGDKSADQPPEPAEVAPVKEGEMNEQQARLLLESMKADEQKVQLDERKAARRVYNDW